MNSAHTNSVTAYEALLLTKKADWGFYLIRLITASPSAS